MVLCCFAFAFFLSTKVAFAAFTSCTGAFEVWGSQKIGSQSQKKSPLNGAYLVLLWKLINGCAVDDEEIKNIRLMELAGLAFTEMQRAYVKQDKQMVCPLPACKFELRTCGNLTRTRILLF